MCFHKRFLPHIFKDSPGVSSVIHKQAHPPQHPSTRPGTPDAATRPHLSPYAHLPTSPPSPLTSWARAIRGLLADWLGGSCGDMAASLNGAGWLACVASR